jgi:hypothetical protein
MFAKKKKVQPPPLGLDPQPLIGGINQELQRLPP